MIDDLERAPFKATPPHTDLRIHQHSEIDTPPVNFLWHIYLSIYFLFFNQMYVIFV